MRACVVLLALGLGACSAWRPLDEKADAMVDAGPDGGAGLEDAGAPPDAGAPDAQPSDAAVDDAG